ncbi:MAG: (2Fe-2S)-binding protein [Bacillota bacterium]|nr:(2Fe-2S)-binding protein [Bacillota bacterium]
MPDTCGSGCVCSGACPRCGSAGSAVPAITVRSLVKAPEEEKVAAAGGYLLCLNPACEVVYFQPGGGRLFTAAGVPVWFKDEGPDVPLCYCAGVTRGEIRRAVEEGCPPTLEAVRERTGAGKGGRCLVENPSGRCCHGALADFLAGLVK